MNDNPPGTPVTSNNTPSESVSSTSTNYSRWMTDMALEIAHLKLYQLAIPGAHNSGVDQSGKFHVGNKWAACQYDSFPQQLSAGARYLDLRLVDNSYKKTIGNHNPTYKFIEVFEFEHGGISAGRRLEHLVGAVNSFATANPFEIIFIDFHHYDRGRNHSSDSLQRCLPKFNPIKNRLIPPSASDLSIGEIRQNHPGCNIVLCLAHNYPVPSGNEQDKWPNGTVRREQIWHPLRHEWTPEASESNIISLVVNSMKSPPESYYWVLSAAVTEQTFPKDLATTNPVRTEAFKPGFQNANILMVDFIDGSNSKVSVTDRCINLNRQRASDRISPPGPTRLVVTTKDGTTIGGKFQNTLVFNWSQALDNLGIRKYEIYRNGEKFAPTSKMPYEHKNFYLKNYSFKVKAIDCVDNHSEFSNTFDLIQDSIPPTIPGNLELVQGRVGTSVTLSWDHSIDEAGVAGYEIYLDNEFLRNEPYNNSTNRASTDIYDLTNTQQYEVKIRAKDINELYSEFATITLCPRPKVVNPRYSIAGYDELTEKYNVNIVWDTDAYSSAEIMYEGQTKWYSGHAEYRELYRPESGEGPTFNFQASQNERITHRCITWYGRYPVGEFVSFDFVFDSTPPVPTNNLKVTSRTQSATSISWAPSTSADITNYAISVNEEIPVLVSKSVNTYTFEQMPLDEAFSIEVWAINNVDACSIIENLTIEPVDNAAPDKPGVPTITNITSSGAQISWTPASDNVAVAGYTITINNKPPISTTHTQHTLTGLEEANQYTVEIKAIDASGNLSEPATASFTTKYSLPGNPGTPQISKITHSSAELRWAASSGLDVQYKVSLNGFLIATTKETFFTVSHLRGHTDYQVEVQAFNPGGVSGPVATRFRTLLVPPVNLRFSHLNGRCRLAWNPVFGVLPSHEISINGRVFNTGPGRWGYSFKLQDLSPGPAPHHFTFKVRAQLDGASSEVSLLEKSLVDDAPPSQPGAPTISNISDTSATITWSPSSDNVGVTEYLVVLNGFLVFTTPDPRYTFSKLTTGAHHYVYVRAKDKDGNLSTPSKIAAFKTTGQAPLPPPSAPRVNITAETATSLSLNWGSLEGASGVRILLNDEHWRDVFMLSSMRIPNLVPSVEYTISVSTFDVLGQLSEPTVITHELKDTTPPSSPGNLRKSASSPDSVTLAWTASTDDIGICDYIIYNNHEYFDRTPLTQYSAIGLMPGTHRFEVLAQDLSGNLSAPTSLDVHIGG
ncbi:Exoglucanase B precursor [compost metagenome]